MANKKIASKFKDKKSKKLFLFVFVLLSFVLIALVAIFFSNNSPGSSTSGSEGTSFIPFIGILPALYAATRKNKKLTKNNKERLVLFISAGVAIFILVLYLFLKNV